MPTVLDINNNDLLVMVKADILTVILNDNGKYKYLPKEYQYCNSFNGNKLYGYCCIASLVYREMFGVKKMPIRNITLSNLNSHFFNYNTVTKKVIDITDSQFIYGFPPIAKFAIIPPVIPDYSDWKKASYPKSYRWLAMDLFNENLATKYKLDFWIKKDMYYPNRHLYI